MTDSESCQGSQTCTFNDVYATAVFRQGVHVQMMMCWAETHLMTCPLRVAHHRQQLLMLMPRTSTICPRTTCMAPRMPVPQQVPHTAGRPFSTTAFNCTFRPDPSFEAHCSMLGSGSPAAICYRKSMYDRWHDAPVWRVNTKRQLQCGRDTVPSMPPAAL